MLVNLNRQVPSKQKVIFKKINNQFMKKMYLLLMALAVGLGLAVSGCYYERENERPNYHRRYHHDDHHRDHDRNYGHRDHDRD